MTNRLFGNHPTQEDMPFAITYGYAGGVVVANNSVATLSVGSFSMPWTGNMSMTLTGVGSWSRNGHQQWYLHLGSSSPAPNYNSLLSQIAMNTLDTMVGQLPVYATWYNLAKGTVVSFVLVIGVGGGGWNVNLEAWSATVKAWPS